MKDKYTLVGINGNAFAIMAHVGSCMAKEGFSSKDIEQYRCEAKSSTYENLLCVSSDYIDKCNNKKGENND